MFLSALALAHDGGHLHGLVGALEILGVDVEVVVRAVHGGLLVKRSHQYGSSAPPDIALPELAPRQVFRGSVAPEVLACGLQMRLARRDRGW